MPKHAPKSASALKKKMLALGHYERTALRRSINRTARQNAFRRGTQNNRNKTLRRFRQALLQKPLAPIKPVVPALKFKSEPLKILQVLRDLVDRDTNAEQKRSIEGMFKELADTVFEFLSNNDDVPEIMADLKSDYGQLLDKSFKEAHTTDYVKLFTDFYMDVLRSYKKPSDEKTTFVKGLTQELKQVVDKYMEEHDELADLLKGLGI